MPSPAVTRPARASGREGIPRSRWAVTCPDTGGPFVVAARMTEARSAWGEMAGSPGLEEARPARATTPEAASTAPRETVTSRSLADRAILYL